MASVPLKRPVAHRLKRFWSPPQEFIPQFLCTHDGTPYCHKPCYATLFGPKGVNIGGAGSYIYDTPPPTPVSKSGDSPSDGSPTTPWTSVQTAKPPPKGNRQKA
ncbi:hypothetical protein JZ751_027601 [Albula glossodonta]|uniref:Uncharacterized protein n=1 Tax=Albula glossodonta TaxID=121402 RepID=A0A8T2NBW9_9TELE|nr:hypothetical protein JZ751_027601 [Albula glossodonta]